MDRPAEPTDNYVMARRKTVDPKEPSTERRTESLLKRAAVAAMLWSAIGLPASIYNGTATAADAAICERQMAEASQAEGVPLGVLYAVGMTETGNKGSLHPYALNIQGKTVFTDSPQAALAEFAKARAQGIRLIDLGCMQINHHYHGRNFQSPAAMLDPATNVTYAARYLRTLRRQEGNWTMAVARYHAGPNNNPAQKQYICAVIHNLTAAGFGAWTPEARRFCR